MGNLLNAIIAILIVVIVAAVSSTYFYRKGQESSWELSQKLIPLEKNEIYVAVERTDATGVSYLTVQKASDAATDKNLDQRELRFRLKLALNGLTLQEYNDKYRDGKKGL